MKYYRILTLSLLCVNFVMAREFDTDHKNSLISISGNGHIMFGQIVSGYQFKTFDANHVDWLWQNFYSGRINITSQPVDWFTAIMGSG